MGKEARVPCSVCGRKTEDYVPRVHIGLCARCQRVYCKDCLGNLKKKACTTCGEKVVETKRVKDWPWPRVANQPPLAQVIRPPGAGPMSARGATGSFCIACGAPLPAGSAFCNTCGAKQ